jgi:hypothetical protein
MSEYRSEAEVARSNDVGVPASVRDEGEHR